MKIKDLFNSRTKLTSGFTTVTKNGKSMKISHGGNMGNSITESVDPNLKMLGFPTISELKELFPNYVEKGSPDYIYVITFKE